jgi:hypothetical protein
MNHQDKSDLRDLRDQIEDPEDKKLLRKAVNHIAALEARLFTIKVHTRSILAELSSKSNSEGD